MATETTKLTFVEGAAPSTPASGRVVTYAKADGFMYSKDDAGVEKAMYGSAAGGVLAATTYSTGADTAWATSTSSTPADIDATNAALAITVPASGKIVVMASIDWTLGVANNGGYLWLRSGSTDHQSWTLIGPNAAVGGIGGLAVSGGRATALFYVAGLTPGALTVKLGFSRIGTSSVSVYAYDGTGASGHLAGPFVMVAFAA